MNKLIDDISGYQFTADINGYHAERFDLTKPVISLFEAWKIIKFIFGPNIPFGLYYASHNDG